MSTSREKIATVTLSAACGAAMVYFYQKISNSRPKGSSLKLASKDGERTYLIGGNWKCNNTMAQNEELIQIFNKAGPIPSNVEVAICAPYPYLTTVLKSLRSDISVGAQDCGVNLKKGAYTGEVAAFQLKDIGCSWVIVGHSERRAGFGGDSGESNQVCAKKAQVALEAGLKVMFAIGETKEQREAGKTLQVCAEQLKPLASLLPKSNDWENMAIAYEPVWAIGTGLTATPEMAQETHLGIRQWISQNVAPSVAKSIRIQYGGSMKGKNARELLEQPDIDGGLIGGASLTADFFNVVNGVLK